MALLIGDKGVFLHIPKTGGTWFRHAATAAGLKVKDLGLQHGGLSRLIKTGIVPEGFFDDKIVFTIVRHPVTWYQSRWCFRVKHGWHAEHPLDMACANNDFQAFVENVLRFKPDGWVSWLYRSYNEDKIHPADIICHTETMLDDLVSVLSQVGDFDEDVFRSHPRSNDSDMDGQSSKYWAKYTPELLDRVLAVEQDAIVKYYPEYSLDKSKFVGERPYA